MRYCLVCLMGSGLESVYLKLFGLVSVKVFELVYEYSKLYLMVYCLVFELVYEYSKLYLMVLDGVLLGVCVGV